MTGEHTMGNAATGNARGTTMNARTSKWGRWVRATGLAALLALAAPMAQAAPCAGFADVDDSDAITGPFCTSVQWIKNRGVTLGCVLTPQLLYCPFDNVTRLQMAAFMKRLGDALTPIRLTNDLRPGAVDLDLNPVVCQTADFAVTNFPRTAYADATLSMSAAADVSFAGELVFSLDTGTTWTALNTQVNLGSAPANQYGSLSDIGTKDLDVGQNVRFGLRLRRGGIASAVNLTDSRCQLRAMIYSRTGAAPPI
jgi:hypothetical protein